MAKNKKMSTTQVIVPRTDFILEGILEDLAKDLGLAIQDKPLPDEDYTSNRFVEGQNFNLSYHRWYMDDEVEDEHLIYNRDSVQAYASTCNQTYVGPDENNVQKRDLLYFSYKVPESQAQKHRLLLSNLTHAPGDLAVRLAIGTWRFDSDLNTHEEEVCQLICNYPDEKIFNPLTAEEIYTFLKNHISLSK